MITIKKSDITITAYSQTNRTLDINKQDYRIVLYDAENKAIISLKMVNTYDSAKVELEKLSKQLGLTLI